MNLLSSSFWSGIGCFVRTLDRTLWFLVGPPSAGGGESFLVLCELPIIVVLHWHYTSTSHDTRTTGRSRWLGRDCSNRLANYRHRILVPSSISDLSLRQNTAHWARSWLYSNPCNAVLLRTLATAAYSCGAAFADASHLPDNCNTT